MCNASQSGHLLLCGMSDGAATQEEHRSTAAPESESRRDSVMSVRSFSGAASRHAVDIPFALHLPILGQARLSNNNRFIPVFACSLFAHC